MQNRLLKNLSEIAARELKITKGVNPQWKDKAELLVIAYGQSKIEADFYDWIESVRNNKPDSPVTDYLKIVDERLGSAPVVSEDDPRVTSLIAMAYKSTGRPPSKTDIQKLLDIFSQEEIERAWFEYIDKLDDNELKYATKNFFRDGGARGIILARQQTEKEKIELEKTSIESVVAGMAAHVEEEKELQQRMKEEEEEARRFAENPTF